MEARGQPAFVLYVQTFGDLVTFNPHIHALVADGVFLPSGKFRVLSPLPETALCEALRHKVLDFLSAVGVLSADLAERMKTWRHSGFSAIAPALLYLLHPCSRRSTIAFAAKATTPKADNDSPAT